MKRFLLIPVVAALCLAAGVTLAHTPVTRTFLLSPGGEFHPGQEIAIGDPTESLALYGVVEEPRQAAVYGFEVQTPYRLRALLQVPVVPDDLYRDWRPELVLVGPADGESNSRALESLLRDGVRFTPEFTSIMHEPFGHSDYHRGPAFERELSPGRYLLMVYSPQGAGAYTLALGERETARSVIQAVVQRRELDKILAAGGRVPLRSPLGLSVYHYLLILGSAFVLPAWLLWGWAQKGGVRRWAVGLLDLLAVLALALGVLFVWVSVLPGWVRLASSALLFVEIAAVFHRGRGLRLAAWAGVALLVAICML